jgi:hypothetical protein
MPNEILARKIYSFQNKIVRELNDAHIFLAQAQPLLLDARARYEESKSKSDRRYFVPSIDKRKVAKRTDKELKEIYDRPPSTGRARTSQPRPDPLKAAASSPATGHADTPPRQRNRPTADPLTTEHE